MSCQNKLSWYELIPLVSFLALGGRCRTCKTKISRMYPAVELLTGIIFLSLFLKFQELLFINFPVFLITYAYYAAVFSFLVVIAFYDLRHKIIPDFMSFGLGALTLSGLFFFDQHGFNPHIPPFWDFLSGPLLAAPFALFWLISKGMWMGLGDAKLAVSLGWFLGLSRSFSGAAISFWIGAVFGIFLLLFSRGHSMRSEVPFAPFLALGAVLAFFFELYLFPIL